MAVEVTGGRRLVGQLVQIENISKVYQQVEVLNRISLTIDKQQIIAFLGGNGVGKSTLLRIIAGIERPTSGKVTYRDKKMSIGYVPERFPKDIRFTPGEYLTYIGEISGLPERERRETIDGLMRRFKLNEYNHERVMNLSKGNIQKVGIIQGVMRKPDLLILDEPISGLDADSQQELVKLMQELKEEGTTILLTYHEADLFEKVVDVAFDLTGGRLSKKVADEKETLKKIELERIDEQVVMMWEEVRKLEKKNDSLVLHVHAKDSDTVLYRILKLNGSVRSVHYYKVQQSEEKID